MTDLYQVLGIRKNAKANAIKLAFRKRAMATHPDRGGDKTEFELVQLAYQVLSDPVRREHYDQTGEYAANQANNQDAEAMQMLVMAMNKAMEMLSQTGDDPTTANVADRMKAVLDRFAVEPREKIRVLKKTADFLSLGVGRFKTVGEPKGFFFGYTPA